ncbi:MAG TPA: transglycosylase SLT domain-containing protein [Desulfuromonadales bacterium]|nr:transglycosylase SLT domain-containing protein [Desulfuromonadales bacterium]
MRKKLFYLLCVLVLSACENAPFKVSNARTATMLTTESSHPDSSRVARIQRMKQLTAIESAFARRTTPERAAHLARICYDKTVGTVFTPFDLAEIALAETGGHQLSAHAVSSEGAVGVWQLMPRRARNHGYTAADMRDDAKCAEAAVRELYVKLDMAQGDLERAKKYYCGQGPQALAYLKKIRHIRREMMVDYERQNDKVAQSEPLTKIR